MADIAAGQARAAIARGDLLAAYDLVRPEGAASPSAERAYLAVLAMARMGAVDEAARLYDCWGLGSATDLDTVALGARLLKDRALASGLGDASFGAAAAAYAAIHARTDDPFPAINAATLSLLSGDTAGAATFAQAALAAPAVGRPTDYYGAATKAEALLVLGRTTEAMDALTAALTMPGADYGARSTTLRQFALLAGWSGTAEVQPLIDLLRPPGVAVFTGHIFRNCAAREAELGRRIDALLEARQIGFGYGALAAGGDILIVERLVGRGAEVHLVLPFAERDFVAQSVTTAGGDWPARYERARAAAASVSFATVAEDVGDPAQFGYGADVAMGMARLRARHLGSRVIQIALWDGQPGAVAGTGHDVASWRSTGGETVVVDGSDLDRSVRHAATAEPVPRSLKAMLFADFPGFTRIPETRLPVFWERVMTAAGRLLDRHRPSVEFANSWGDAVFAVIGSVEVAAEVALQFQDVLAAIDPADLGLETPTRMRVSLHYGPVYSGADAFTGGVNYYGSEVSRAARVEPLTPPGSVYVSEQFAAILTNTAPDAFATTYVGKLQLPKGFGQYPLFALRRRAASVL